MKPLLKRYAEWSPTPGDPKGAFLEDRGEWLVLPLILCPNVATCLDESNWQAAINILDGCDDYEVRRFGHWLTPFEIVIVAPGTVAHARALTIAARLADYPILDEADLSEREMRAANELWRDMRPAHRLDYIRRHRYEFEFRSFADMLGCARGRYFAGDASELLS